MTELSLSAEAVGRVTTQPTAPRDPDAGEVRVAVERCGICGSDLHWFLGRMPLPGVCPGHEISGMVDSVGTGVSGWTRGDRVTIEPIARCGECPRCLVGDYHLCRSVNLYGVGLPGGMASHVVVPAYCLYRLPPSVDYELGALAEPLAVTVHALRLANVGADSTVLVLGAGTIGQLTVAAARHLGARRIAATARYPQQRKAAERLGCDEVLSPEQPRMLERPNVVIETVGGHATTVADAVQVIDAGGTVVITGLFDDTPKFDPLTMLMKEVRIVASMVYNRHGPVSDFDTSLEILAARAEDLRPLVTHTFPLSEAQHAFQTAADKAGGAIKVMLAPSARS
jgi:2-desacetyl-2-hydroxyethyl bacteriochlorophyllide A dehydrogenase